MRQSQHAKHVKQRDKQDQNGSNHVNPYHDRFLGHAVQKDTDGCTEQERWNRLEHANDGRFEG